MPLGVSLKDCSTANGPTEDVVLRRATPEQAERHTTLIMQVWNGPVETAEELFFYQRYLATAFQKDVEPYVLVPPDRPATLDLRAASTLIPVPFLLLRPGATNPIRVTGWILDDLLVPPPWRGKSYSLKLAMELAREFRARQDISMAFGHSEMGTSIYLRAGGRVYLGKEVIVSARDFMGCDLADVDDVQHLSLNGVLALVPYDHEDVLAKLRAAQAETPNEAVFAMLPTHDQYLAKYTRVLGRLEWMRGADRVPRTLGFKIDQKNFCFFTHNLVHGTLFVLRFVCDGTSNAHKLLTACCQEAAYWDLGNVVLWDFAYPQIAHELKLYEHEREDDFILVIAKEGRMICLERAFGFTGAT